MEKTLHQCSYICRIWTVMLRAIAVLKTKSNFFSIKETEYRYFKPEILIY
jgi:hypothetical protein